MDMDTRATFKRTVTRETRSVTSGTLPWSRVALVADIFHSEDSNAATSRRRDLERTDRKTVDEIAGGIEQLGLEVVHLEKPADLSSARSKLDGAIVLSTFGGVGSPNRLV